MSQKGRLTGEVETELLAKAWNTLEHAHAPYSGFPVGAAVLTESDEIFVGANVECASYPSGTCAEVVAITSAVSAGHRKFQAIAVVTNAVEPAAPCGECRQVLAEFGLDYEVIFASKTKVRCCHVRDLLPLPFGGKALPGQS